MGMDSKRLSKRKKQPGHDRTFEAREARVSACLRELLNPEEFQVEDKPRDLAGLFPRIGGGRPYGVVPEASIISVRSGRKLFFEVKKQGLRGNADERACKHHTVEFYATLHARFGYDFHPFFTVFCEHLATDKRYLSKHPYFFASDQYFCWVDYDDPSPLTAWIDSLCRRHLG